MTGHATLERTVWEGWGEVACDGVAEGARSKGVAERAKGTGRKRAQQRRGPGSGRRRRGPRGRLRREVPGRGALEIQLLLFTFYINHGAKLDRP